MCHRFFLPLMKIIICFVLLKCVYGELTIMPTIADVLVGEQAIFNCSTSVKNSEIQWFHFPVGQSSERQLVYGYDQFSPNYKGFQMDKNTSTGEFNLIIPSAKLDDAGKYECQDDYGRGEKKEAQLIILESVPVCSSAKDLSKVIGNNNCGIKTDQLLLSCITHYRGHQPPDLKWRKVGDLETIHNYIPQEIIDNKIVSNMTIAGEDVATGDSFECVAARSSSRNARCQTQNVTIIGKTAVLEMCSCKVYIDAIISIVIIFIIAAGIVAGMYLYVFKYKKKQDQSQFRKGNAKEADDLSQEKTLLPSSSGGTDDHKISDLMTQLQKLKKELHQEKDQHQKAKKELDQEKDQHQKANEKFDREKKNLQKAKTELEETQKKLGMEIDDLKKRNFELEQHLYPTDVPDYLEEPTLAHVLRTDATSAINGLAVLENSLFVSHEMSSEIEVYDSKTYVFSHKFTIPTLTLTTDLISCSTKLVLYAIGWTDSTEKTSQIQRFDSAGKSPSSWPSGGNFGRLSTFESNVIVCLLDKLLINEFDYEGQLIRSVRLSPADGFKSVCHAIKVTSMHFVVSQGTNEDKSGLRRICIVNVDGKIIKACADTKKKRTKLQKLEAQFKTRHSSFEVPICLLEDKERSIVVADRAEERIDLLDSTLRYRGKLIDPDKNLTNVTRISFDETGSRLFVAVNKSSEKLLKNGQVLVFNVK